MRDYRLNICPKDSLEGIGALCRREGLPETKPSRVWQRNDHPYLRFVEYEYTCPLLIRTVEPRKPEDPDYTNQIRDFVKSLVEVAGATEVYNSVGEPYNEAVFLPPLLASLFRDSKSYDKGIRHHAIKELGKINSKSASNLLTQIAEGGLRRETYWGLREGNYNSKDRSLARDALG